MSVNLKAVLNDSAVDTEANASQRQLVVEASATPPSGPGVPINLSLVLDRSSSMTGEPIEQVREAAKRVIDQLSPSDFVSIVAFNHETTVLVRHQPVLDKDCIKSAVDAIEVNGGTAIDKGVAAGMAELDKADCVGISRAFVLTDGFNEHGDDQVCLTLAAEARRRDVIFSTFGVGENWDPSLLEQIADAGNGRMHHIETPDQMIRFFTDEVRYLRAVSALNARLQFVLKAGVRLAELEPICQVVPDAIVQKPEAIPNGSREQKYEVRLGTLGSDSARVLIALLYLPKLPEGPQPVVDLCILYDDPLQAGLSTPLTQVSASYLTPYIPQISPDVRPYLDRLSVYKQQRKAEELAAQGKHRQAATLLQTAGNTLLQGGDQQGGTVLQAAATKLAHGQNLDVADKIKTKIVSKTTVQS